MTERPDEARETTPDDVERFLQLFAQHQRQVLGYVYSLVPHTQNAEDIFQKTSLVLWRKFSEFTAGTSFRAWASQIAWFEVLKWREAKGRSAAPVEARAGVV